MDVRTHPHFSQRVLCAFALIVTLAACDSTPPAGDDRVVLVDRCCDGLQTGDLHDSAYEGAVWRGDRVWGGSPLRELTLGPDLRPVAQRVFTDPNGPPPIPGEVYTPRLDFRVQGRYVTADATGDRLLIVRSNYTDVVAGRLTLFEPATGRVEILVDSSEHVSTAVFDPADPGRVVYYKYGRNLRNDPEAGYYALDLRTRQTTLLLRHGRPEAAREGYNAFDLSPDGRTLLYTDFRATPTSPAPPAVILRDLASGQADTLDVPFPFEGLWLRYHPGGRYALYASLTTPPVIGQDALAASELGVLDLQTGGRRVIEVTYPVDSRSGSRVEMPVWSPDGRHVLVGRRGVYEDGTGLGSLYVIRDVM